MSDGGREGGLVGVGGGWSGDGSAGDTGIESVVSYDPG